MSAVLPDVSVTDLAPMLSPLEWVGMQGIDLPVTIDEPGYHRELHATADVQVDLPAPQVKGIHMSRLYRLLDSWGQERQVSPAHIRELLNSMIESHHDCDSRSARIRLVFDLLIRRSALVTEGLSGWKSYPVQVNASLIEGAFSLSIEITIGYSSTCPCSAALSRQLIEEGFLQTFSHQPLIEPAAVAQWLRANASLATPHSQRSEARVSVSVGQEYPNLGLSVLINAVENALGTPVQTAVKRADEQAFAALNGQNLMFVEDAARRIRATLADYSNPKVHVRHLESLHPHDAAAWSATHTQGLHHGK
ncbi:GTP cyclohydrolase FolE2 [Pseudomonas helleri]|uniref:GTP cyclohydrolase FolE2 n=1 Tax=Pseudomonas helleri TaxID=1608996 RepID=A0A7X2C607_9PSED|nr:GTP cyclohydrolase FolE2 [Pseudomonas helleri]MQT92224.1 GTP cyclohydrolase I FolE2 [Pseudomonas helleri]